MKAVLTCSLIGIAILGLVFVAEQSSGSQPSDAQTLARQAVSEDADAAQAAIARLRLLGPEGLAAVLALEPAGSAGISIRNLQAVKRGVAHSDPDTKRWQAAVDAVGAQRDCAASRLFWYTDFDEARRAAQQSGKPILSLRLLGKLTDELSCANSRYFRTTLYANRTVSDALRENFVLYWESLRPVPRVTIDFGDGRRLEQTVTGNSIHYVLDPQGRLVDALPGLYGPAAFLRGLERAGEAARKLATRDGTDRAAELQRYHEDQMQRIDREWNADVRGLADSQPQYRIEAPHPSAQLPDEVWQMLAQRHAQDAQLDQASQNLILRKGELAAAQPPAVRAAAVAVPKSGIENPLFRMLASFQRSIAIDTVRNEYLLHRRIHEWLSVPNLPVPMLTAFNARVYAELFLSPLDDPWHGLLPQDGYTALSRDGIVESGATPRR